MQDMKVMNQLLWHENAVMVALSVHNFQIRHFPVLYFQHLIINPCIIIASLVYSHPRSDT